MKVLNYISKQIFVNYEQGRVFACLLVKFEENPHVSYGQTFNFHSETFFLYETLEKYPLCLKVFFLSLQFPRWYFLPRVFATSGSTMFSLKV